MSGNVSGKSERTQSLWNISGGYSVILQIIAEEIPGDISHNFNIVTSLLQQHGKPCELSFHTSNFQGSQ